MSVCVCVCVCVCVSGGREMQGVSMCVKVKYRWRRPVCVRVSEVQCNCRQSQPYLPVKNTIIPHSPSQAISPVSSSLALFLSLSLSLSASNYNPEGYFSPGQKHSPQALPLFSDSPFALLFISATLAPFPPLSAILFLCWELESGKEQASNTHHLSLRMPLSCICKWMLARWSLRCVRPKVWATVPDGATWNKDAPQVEKQFDLCTVGRSTLL